MREQKITTAAYRFTVTGMISVDYPSDSKIDNDDEWDMADNAVRERFGIASTANTGTGGHDCDIDISLDFEDRTEEPYDNQSYEDEP